MSTATATKFEVGSTYHVQPKTLLLERNIREAKPDQDLIDSIAALGVLEPIGAVVTDDGALLVRSGHRRTLAALEAKTPTVPVYVRGTDDLDPAAEVVRIVEQRHENTRRAGLTTAEDVGSLGQMVAFGLTVEQAAEKAQVSRETVATAIRVTGSKMATKSAERWDELSLDQVAAIAEFEDDADAVKALVQAAHRGQFAHTVQRMRDDRDRDAKIAELRASLEAGGYQFLERRPSYNDKAKPLDRIVDADSAEIQAADHVDCPGRVAWIDYEYVSIHPDGTIFDDLTDAELAAKYGDEDGVSAAEDETKNIQRNIAAYGCADPGKYGHRDRYSSPSSSRSKAADVRTEKQREAEKAARRLVIDNNKAWASAEVVRRRWLAEFGKRKTAPAGAAAFIAGGITIDSDKFDFDVQPSRLSAEWLGIKSPSGGRGDLSAPAAKATEARALVIALVHMLAVYEAKAMTQLTWRSNGTTSAGGRYLRFLESAGYELSDVEKFAISKKTA